MLSGAASFTCLVSRTMHMVDNVFHFPLPGFFVLVCEELQPLMLRSSTVSLILLTTRVLGHFAAGRRDVGSTRAESNAFCFDLGLSCKSTRWTQESRPCGCSALTLFLGISRRDACLVPCFPCSSSSVVRAIPFSVSSPDSRHHTPFVPPFFSSRYLCFPAALYCFCLLAAGYHAPRSHAILE